MAEHQMDVGAQSDHSSVFSSADMSSHVHNVFHLVGQMSGIYCIGCSSPTNKLSLRTTLD